MDRIQKLNELGMIREDDPNYQPPKESVSWDSMIKVLGSYGSPQAQKLYKKLSTRYNLKVEPIKNQERTNTMSDEVTPVAEPVEETPVTETPPTIE